ncbi:hypothetical protein C4F49_12850 [Sphingobacterium sp. KB22]|uniref:Uncharacterized protein n=1 Tax=Sphingobacterium hungaricum TaxID=2082723 RepID=A0A928YRV2_9SPHI|nr:hypothetical protein [Sphingobacterium hungaricum]
MLIFLNIQFFQSETLSNILMFLHKNLIFLIAVFVIFSLMYSLFAYYKKANIKNNVWLSIISLINIVIVFFVPYLFFK